MKGAARLTPFFDPTPSIFELLFWQLTVNSTSFLAVERNNVFATELQQNAAQKTTPTGPTTPSK
jgi:hypothetical protein